LGAPAGTVNARIESGLLALRARLGAGLSMKKEFEEQASRYVRGFLEASESAIFEQHLQADAELRAFVDQLDAAAAAIAHCAPARSLPPELRDKILGQIQGKKILVLLRRGSWIAWAIAGVLALTCAYLLAGRSQLQKRIAHLEQQDILSQVQIVALRSQSVGAPAASAVVVWDEKRQRGVLKIAQIPQETADRDYQLWMVDPRYRNEVSAGVFHVAATGALTVMFQPIRPVREAKQFSVTLERKGGVTKVEGPIVLLGK
jgi:anti-sigma-K factor RskA